RLPWLRPKMRAAASPIFWAFLSQPLATRRARFQASCQPPVFLVLRANYPKSAQPPRHVDRRKSARQMLLPPGRLAPGACNEHTSKTCEIDNALNPFGSWLLEKRCKLGSTASL